MTGRRLLYVFRHGQTDWNREGRIQGHIDVPLNDLGRQQATRLVPHLKRFGIEAVLSSDLSRASETGRLIAEPLGLPMRLDPGLREVHLGELQGLNRAEIERRQGVNFSERLRTSPISDEDIVRLGAEAGESVVLRFRRALAEYFLESAARRVAVVTHGGVVRRMIEASHESRGYPPPVPNGSIYPMVLGLDDGAMIMEPSLPWETIK